MRARPYYNTDSFSVAQMTSTADGKTSASGTMGVLICSIGCLTFLLGVVDRVFFSQSQDIMMQTVVFTGLGVTLLGVKKFRGPREEYVQDPGEYPGPPAPPYPRNDGGGNIDVDVNVSGGGGNYWEQDPFAS